MAICVIPLTSPILVWRYSYIGTLLPSFVADMALTRPYLPHIFISAAMMI